MEITEARGGNMPYIITEKGDGGFGGMGVLVAFFFIFILLIFFGNGFGGNNGYNHYCNNEVMPKDNNNLLVQGFQGLYNQGNAIAYANAAQIYTLEKDQQSRIIAQQDAQIARLQSEIFTTAQINSLRDEMRACCCETKLAFSKLAQIPPVYADVQTACLTPVVHG